MQNYCTELFGNKLQQEDWDSVTRCQTVYRAWATFKTKFLTILDQVAPIKSVRIKNSSEHAWITGEIVHLGNEKNTEICKKQRPDLA